VSSIVRLVGAGIQRQPRRRTSAALGWTSRLLHAKRRYASRPRAGTTAGPLLELIQPVATPSKIIALLDEAGGERL
jgi:hypothetical protein